MARRAGGGSRANGPFSVNIPASPSFTDATTLDSNRTHPFASRVWSVNLSERTSTGKYTRNSNIWHHLKNGVGG